jgi:pantothenate kinase-related protein Tda10
MMNQTWPKDPHLKKLGFYFKHDLLDVVEGLTAPFTRGLGWSLEDVQKLQVEVKKDMNDRKIHAYQIMYVIPLLFCHFEFISSFPRKIWYCKNAETDELYRRVVMGKKPE